MRPPGEIRQAVITVAWEVVRQRRATQAKPLVTLHDLQQHLVPKGVGRKAVKHTWHNLVRAGVLQPVEPVHVQGVCRPLLGCMPADATSTVDATTTLLDEAVRGWARGR